MSKIICAKSEELLPKLQAESFDLLCTDPPYGMSFMGKEWDKALPDKEIWKECLRVLKPGAFAFVMCIPRADCLWRMIRDLELAGFIIKFTPMYWAYASGFPKAQNIGKTLEKRHRKPDKIVEVNGCGGMKNSKGYNTTKRRFIYDKFESNEAKELNGSYAGFQPKPAVEVIIVAMKPLNEKNYVEQARKNKKGITWIDDCRIPVTDGRKLDGGGYSGGEHKGHSTCWPGSKRLTAGEFETPQGRFPANLLVSDDVLNDGVERKSVGGGNPEKSGMQFTNKYGEYNQVDQWSGQGGYKDSGSFSRYFDIDKWFSEMLKQRLGSKFERAAKTFPFLLSPKASKTEKWFYCRVCKSTQEAAREKEHHSHVCWCKDCQEMISQKRMKQCKKKKHKLVPNLIYHPTVKPLRLMAYLVTLGSREGDKVLDPFAGTCKTAMACELLKRNYLMIDSDKIALKLGRAGIEALDNPPLRKKLLKRIE